MSNKPENPPAFPNYDVGLNYELKGMSLRDYFAAIALNGILANPNIPGNYGPKEPNDNLNIAINCYAIAEAMLIARSKP